MYYLNYGLSDWHTGLIPRSSTFGINKENESVMIRIYTDIEEDCTYTLDFRCQGNIWYSVMATGDGYLYYTLTSTDLAHKYLDIQLVGTYSDGTVMKTPIADRITVKAGINATATADDEDATAFTEALESYATYLTQAIESATTAQTYAEQAQSYAESIDTDLTTLETTVSGLVTDVSALATTVSALASSSTTTYSYVVGVN